MRLLFNMEPEPVPWLGAPTIFDYRQDAKSSARCSTFFSGNTQLGRPLMAPPGVPAERVEALRQAFDATMREPAFLKEAETMGFEVAPQIGRRASPRWSRPRSRRPRTSSSLRSARPRASRALYSSISLEIAQVRRRLILAGRHQEAVGAKEILLLADLHLVLVLAADGLEPGRFPLPVVGPRHRPGTRKRIIDHRDVVAQDRSGCPVEVDALVHHGSDCSRGTAGRLNRRRAGRG